MTKLAVHRPLDEANRTTTSGRSIAEAHASIMHREKERANRPTARRRKRRKRQGIRTP
jgi:hypothetical protein